MAEAQNKLGELFVDIGSSGLGKLVKGLNSLSASFLLTKKGAENFIKPIQSMNTNAMQSVIGYDKLNAVTGISITKLQELSKWAQLNNVDFGQFMGQVQGLQNQILQIQTGQGGKMNGLALLGIDPRSLDATKPLEALDKIRSRVMQLKDPAMASYALNMLGLSQDLIYAWRQGNEQLDKRLLLNERQMDNLRDQQGAWNSLKVTWTSAMEKFLSEQTWLNKLLKQCTEWLTQISTKALDMSKQKWFGEALEDVKFLGKELKLIWTFLEKIHDAIAAFGRFLGENMVDDSFLATASQLKGGPILRYKIYKEEQERQKKYIENYRQTLPKQTAANKVGAQPVIQSMGNPTIPKQIEEYNLPPLPATTNNSVNLQVTQNITAPDPTTAAQKSNEMLHEQINTQLAEYNNQWGI